VVGIKGAGVVLAHRGGEAGDADHVLGRWLEVELCGDRCRVCYVCIHEQQLDLHMAAQRFKARCSKDVQGETERLSNVDLFITVLDPEDARTK